MRLYFHGEKPELSAEHHPLRPVMDNCSLRVFKPTPVKQLFSIAQLVEHRKIVKWEAKCGFAFHSSVTCTDI